MGLVFGENIFFQYVVPDNNHKPSRTILVDARGNEVSPAQLPAQCMLSIAGLCQNCPLNAQPGTSGTHTEGSCQGIGTGFVASFRNGLIPSIAKCFKYVWRNQSR